MKIFTLIVSLLLIGLGTAAYYNRGEAGDGAGDPLSAIPAGIGILVLSGVVISLFLRRTGLQICLLGTLAGVFSGLGRLTPLYLKGIFDWKSHPANLIIAMTLICLVYLLVRMVTCLLPKRSRNDEAVASPSKEETESIPC